MAGLLEREVNVLNVGLKPVSYTHLALFVLSAKWISCGPRTKYLGKWKRNSLNQLKNKCIFDRII